MKQIRLKDTVMKFNECSECPCVNRDDFFGDIQGCNIGDSYSLSGIPDDCPLEDAE